jgi:hypothetical protein
MFDASTGTCKPNAGTTDGHIFRRVMKSKFSKRKAVLFEVVNKVNVCSKDKVVPVGPQGIKYKETPFNETSSASMELL